MAEPVDVFFSYARPDKPLVAKLVERCRTEGWSIWWDHALDTGDEFAETIQQRLQTAKCIVVCWSRSSSASRWVRDEAGVAVERGVAVPVSLDGTAPPLGFGQFHTADVSQFVNGQAADVSDVIGGIRKTVAGGRAAALASSMIRRRGKPWSAPLVIAAGIAIAAVLVAVATFLVSVLLDYSKPAAPTRYTQLKKAEILMSEVDDFMTVVINDKETLRAQFGQATNWTDVTSHFIKGANKIAMTILNGQYGGCGGALQLRMNGFVSPDHQWKFGTAAGNTEGKAPNVMCYAHVFTVVLD